MKKNAKIFILFILTVLLICFSKYYKESLCRKNGHQVDWPTHYDNTFYISGTCKICGKELTKATDWEQVSSSLIIGHWKAIKFAPYPSYNRQAVTDNIYVQICADGTGIFENDDHTESFIWNFVKADVDDSDFYFIDFNFQFSNDSLNRTLSYNSHSELSMDVDEGIYYFIKTLDSSAIDHKVDTWELIPNHFTSMRGKCSDCDQIVSVDTDWSLFVDNLPIGQWQLKQLTDRNSNNIPITQNVELIINTNHSVELITPEMTYNFTWSLKDIYAYDDSPHYVICYYLEDYDDNIFTFDYFNDDCILIGTDDIFAYFYR